MGGKFNKNNDRDHLVVAEGKNYQQKLFYINKGMENNVVKYAWYYTFYKTSKTLGMCNFPK